MLTPEQLAEVTTTMLPLLDGLNVWITKDMIRRFMARLDRQEGAVLTGTDQWQAQVLQEAGGHLEALQARLQQFSKASAAEIQAIFEEAGIQSYAADNAFYIAAGVQDEPRRLSPRMVQILEDSYRRTYGDVQNFTRTTAHASQQRLIGILDRSHMAVLTGAASYTKVVKDAVNELSAQQTRVTYPTGHTDTIETAVLRAVRTGVAQATGNMALQDMEDRGWDLIRVSAHIGARYGDGGENPGNHFWWQGGLYSRTGATPGYPLFTETTGYGTGEGLSGWNCRHSFGPGDPDHNPYADFAADENKRVFDLSQKQRSLESKIRRQKLQVLGLREARDATEDPETKAALEAEYQRAAVKLQRLNGSYTEFCEANGLKKLSDRITIAQWNRSEAAKAAAAARRAI